MVAPPLAWQTPPSGADAVMTPVKFTLRERSSCWDDDEADEAGEADEADDSHGAEDGPHKSRTTIVPAADRAIDRADRAIDRAIDRANRVVAQPLGRADGLMRAESARATASEEKDREVAERALAAAKKAIDDIHSKQAVHTSGVPLQRALRRSRPFWETQEERKQERRREPKLDSHQQGLLDSTQRSHEPRLLTTTASRPANRPSATRFPPPATTRYPPAPDLECDQSSASPVISSTSPCDQSSASPVISGTECIDLECGHRPASPPPPARPAASSKVTGSPPKARCFTRCTSPSAQHITMPEQSAQQEVQAWSTARQEAQAWSTYGSSKALLSRKMVIQWSKLRAPSIASPPEGPTKRRSVRDMAQILEAYTPVSTIGGVITAEAEERRGTMIHII